MRSENGPAQRRVQQAESRSRAKTKLHLHLSVCPHTSHYSRVAGPQAGAVKMVRGRAGGMSRSLVETDSTSLWATSTRGCEECPEDNAERRERRQGVRGRGRVSSSRTRAACSAQCKKIQTRQCQRVTQALQVVVRITLLLVTRVAGVAAEPLLQRRQHDGRGLLSVEVRKDVHGDVVVLVMDPPHARAFDG
jgi:hypothetical protein